MKLATLPFVYGLLLAAPVCFAQAPPKPAPFVTTHELDATAILPAPPANDSAQAREELAELHRIQDTRTPAEIAHAQADDKEESMFAFADVIGAWFRRGSLPLVAVLSDHVKANESPIVNPAKTLFQRPRPFILDKTIHPVCKADPNRPTDYSYPSGHGVTGFLEALVLIRMVPEKRDAILARAEDYARSREVCGVHYPSDEIASKAVAYAIFALMSNDERFSAELEAATVELRATLSATAAAPITRK